VFFTSSPKDEFDADETGWIKGFAAWRLCRQPEQSKGLAAPSPVMTMQPWRFARIHLPHGQAAIALARPMGFPYSGYLKCVIAIHAKNTSFE
jgi:nitroreductase